MPSINLKSKKGQGSVEYLLLLAVVIAALVAARQAMLQPLNKFFETYVKGFSETYNSRNPASTGGKALQYYYTRDSVNPQQDARIEAD